MLNHEECASLMLPYSTNWTLLARHLLARTHRSRSFPPNVPVLHKACSCWVSSVWYLPKFSKKNVWTCLDTVSRSLHSAVLDSLRVSLSNSFLGVFRSTRTFFGSTWKVDLLQESWGTFRNTWKINSAQHHKFLWHCQFNPWVVQIYIEGAMQLRGQKMKPLTFCCSLLSKPN